MKNIEIVIDDKKYNLIIGLGFIIRYEKKCNVSIFEGLDNINKLNVKALYDLLKIALLDEEGNAIDTRTLSLTNPAKILNPIINALREIKLEVGDTTNE